MNTNTAAFDQLALSKPVLQALDSAGYEKPSPIQALTIPVLLEGRDVLGQAQTGTGKTAAFALPALSQLDLRNKSPQILVLAPTRELAIQVAEAFKTYATHLKGFHVLPVYGGQDYRVQTRALDRGVHAIVGTPGRIMDHMRRGNIKLHQLRTFILDEADEMLRMGFIDDVEWIMEQLPTPRQTALFSATMPRQIERIANKYLNDPEIVKIEVKTKAATTIRQRFWSVTNRNKLDALTRILEAEEFDAMLIFVRTRTSTVELSEKLEARGYASAPLNGDIQQKMRERTVDQLKKGKLDIIVATDVAARGLDVSRISHVLNFDIPSDIESYVHRIGRTGRAGRSGEAILFVTPREKRMMQSIEHATGNKIEQLVLPTSESINQQRIDRFQQRINETISNENLQFFEKIINEYKTANPEHKPEQIAAALAHLLQGETPFLHSANNQPSNRSGGSHRSGETHQPRAGQSATRRDSRKGRVHPLDTEREARNTQQQTNSKVKRPEKQRKQVRSESDHPQPPVPVKQGLVKQGPVKQGPATRGPEVHRQEAQESVTQESKTAKAKTPMQRYRLEVGKIHDVKASNIVGAIANEAGIESRFIGTVKIFDDHSLIDLPEGMPKAIYKDLKKVWVCGQKLQISSLDKKRPKKSGETASDSQRKNARSDSFDRDKPARTGKNQNRSESSRQDNDKNNKLKSRKPKSKVSKKTKRDKTKKDSASRGKSKHQSSDKRKTDKRKNNRKRSGKPAPVSESTGSND